MTENEFNYKGVRVVAKDFAEAQAKLRDHAESGEWWLILFDGGGMALVEEITRRHYWTADSDDVFCCLVPARDGLLGCAVFRRRLMLAPKYQWILSKHDVVLSAAEITASGAILRVYEANENAARGFAARLGLGVKGAGLAMES